MHREGVKGENGDALESRKLGEYGFQHRRLNPYKGWVLDQAQFMSMGRRQMEPYTRIKIGPVHNLP